MLYGLGGCILGVLWLLRRRWLLWRPALAAGLVVGALIGAALLANAPAAWFALRHRAETSRRSGCGRSACALAALRRRRAGLGVVFMAAEEPRRAARFRTIRSCGGCGRARPRRRRRSLGRTVGGYLFVPLELALIAAFYYATNRWLGWWQPSEQLTDPNILASAVPALAPIAMSLQAGFMEECVFRAHPARARRADRRALRRRALGIGIAFVLQASCSAPRTRTIRASRRIRGWWS